MDLDNLTWKLKSKKQIAKNSQYTSEEEQSVETCYNKY